MVACASGTWPKDAGEETQVNYFYLIGEHAGSYVVTLLDGVVDDITDTIKDLFDVRRPHPIGS